MPIAYEAVAGVATAETLRQPGVLDWAVAEHQGGRGGPLAGGVSGTAFLTHRSIVGEGGTQTPHPLAAQPLPIPASSGPSRTPQFRIQKEFLESDTEADIQVNFVALGLDPYRRDCLSGAFTHTDPGNYVCMAGVLNHPLSRGSVHISSSNPKMPPVIDPNYLADPADLEMMVDAALFIQKTAETKPLADFIKDRERKSDDETSTNQGKKLMPAFSIDQRLDRESAARLVRNATTSSWHPIGTCSMLPREHGGVVDSRLRVYGVQNLRIVDASIMPLHVRGNISSSVYAIAERAADLIKEDWKLH